MSINIKNLLTTFEQQEIIYCSWKNNHLFKDVLKCKKDLDIYIPLRQKAKFLSILQENNFIEGESTLSSFPYIRHYYTPGQNGRLFHLHVYFRLLTGESHIKDYWLPFENLLEQHRIRKDNILYVPDDETQRLIYLLRHYLKKSSVMGLLMHWRDRDDYLEELNQLKCMEISNKTAHIINNELVTLLDSSLGNAGLIKTWWLGIRLRFQMSSLKRISTFRAFIFRYGNMAFRIINKLTIKRKKTIPGGGRFIAITGLDGSGKTSIIEYIHSVLSKDFTVKKIHIGRPPATIITLPVRLTLTIRKKVKSKKGINSNNKKKTTLEKTSLLAALRYAALAYERNTLARKSYRSACRGEIIISDRYPSVNLGKMDSPRISANNASLLVKWLARIEQHYYKMMPKPDLLIELHVPVEVAIKRNQERLKEDKETDDEIKERYKDNSNLKYKALKHLKLNNDQPFKIASKKLLDTIWMNLL